jgi:hypothetical protein
VKVLGDQPRLLESPEQMVAVIKAKLVWFVAAVVVLAVAYAGVVVWRGRKAKAG